MKTDALNDRSAVDRRNFLKICLGSLTGICLNGWLKPFSAVGAQGLKEARYYRSADTLAG